VSHPSNQRRRLASQEWKRKFARRRLQGSSPDAAWAAATSANISESPLIDGNAASSLLSIDATDYAVQQRTNSSTTKSQPRFVDTISFLYQGASATQFGVNVSAFDEARVSVITGKIVSNCSSDSGCPVSNVMVRAPRRPELGYTFTRSDGGYDFVANGGVKITLQFTHTDFIGVTRTVDVLWHKWQKTSPAYMLHFDHESSNVTLGAAVGGQMVTSSLTSDGRGNRSASIFFPDYVNVTVQRGGINTTLNGSLTVRSTEYTVGEDGPSKMPSVLPPNSAYTYALELTVDESYDNASTSSDGRRRLQTANGVTPEVSFDRPLAVFVDDFVGLPAGSRVPSGFYNASRELWVPTTDGVVVHFLYVNQAGLAELDLNDDGLPEVEATYAFANITSEERRRLAQTREACKSYWRMPVSHFTPYDFNFQNSNSGPPDGADGPGDGPGNNPPDNDEGDNCGGSGSYIEYETQVNHCHSHYRVFDVD
jgi:hypothetical protein